MLKSELVPADFACISSGPARSGISFVASACVHADFALRRAGLFAIGGERALAEAACHFGACAVAIAQNEHYAARKSDIAAKPSNFKQDLGHCSHEQSPWYG